MNRDPKRKYQVDGGTIVYDHLIHRIRKFPVQIKLNLAKIGRLARIQNGGLQSEYS